MKSERKKKKRRYLCPISPPTSPFPWWTLCLVINGKVLSLIIKQNGWNWLYCLNWNDRMMETGVQTAFLKWKCRWCRHAMERYFVILPVSHVMWPEGILSSGLKLFFFLFVWKKELRRWWPSISNWYQTQFPLIFVAFAFIKYLFSGMCMAIVFGSTAYWQLFICK